MFILQKPLDRHSIRLRGHDYQKGGMYFVTICTENRKQIFGEIRNGIMGLSDAGCIVAQELQMTPIIRPYVRLDDWCIMPNHIHVIFEFDNDDWRAGTTNGLRAGTTQRVAPTTLRAGSLGSMIGQLKSVTTKRINELHGVSGVKIWQRNYYERIIRTEDECVRIRRYILNNPQNWEFDRNNASDE